MKKKRMLLNKKCSSEMLFFLECEVSSPHGENVSVYGA